MEAVQQDRSMKRRRSGARKSSKLPITAHPAFAPLLGLWGAALGAMVVMVLPAAMFTAVLDGTLLGVLSGIAQPLAAVLAALVLGTVLYAPAAAVHGRARRSVGRPAAAERTVKDLTPINPARDLGSLRLDDPLDAMPFASPAWRDADLEAVQTEPLEAPHGPSVPDCENAPRELDLAAFAELPGRNAVWVEDEPQGGETSPIAAPVAPLRAAAPPAAAKTAAPSPAPGTAALARLRAVPTEALSLPQMVERFAGALHEHRAAPSARALSAADLAAREAALAEALKALAALSGGPGAKQDDAQSGHHEEPLRAALAQLHARREAGRGAG